MRKAVNGSADPPSRDTRSQIVAAALREFEAHGYEASTVRSIARDVGLTTPALYYHFANKEAILMAVVGPYLDDVSTMLEEHGGSDDESGGSARALLAEYMRVLYRHRAIARFLYRDLAASNHPAIKGVAEGLLADMRRRLAGNDDELMTRVRVAAALGVLRRPILWLDDDLETVLPGIAEMAADVLASK